MNTANDDDIDDAGPFWLGYVTGSASVVCIWALARYLFGAA